MESRKFRLLPQYASNSVVCEQCLGMEKVTIGEVLLIASEDILLNLCDVEFMMLIFVDGKEEIRLN